MKTTNSGDRQMKRISLIVMSAGFLVAGNVEADETGVGRNGHLSEPPATETDSASNSLWDELSSWFESGDSAAE